MKDIFDSKVLCEKCNTLTTKKTMVKDGFKIRVLECPKCGNIIPHPVDVEKFNEFSKIKKKQFNVKLRMVGNSYTVSIPREIIDFFSEEEEIDPFQQMHKRMKEDMANMSRMVTMALEQSNRLSLNFGPEENYDRTIVLIEKNDLKYDDNLTKFVCEAIEHIFTERKCGDLKKSIAILILKPYFNDDEELIGKFIELILEKITKSTKFSRIKNKIGGFFFQLLSILAKL